VSLLALAVAGRPVAAGASPAASADVVEADDLFYQAKRLIEQGRVSAACQKLSESLAIRRRGGTLLNLAVCRAAQGRYATAMGLFGEASELAQTDGRIDRQRFALAQMEEARAKLSWLTVTPAPHAAAAGLRIECDGRELPPADWGTPRPIDPGRHAVTASLPGAQGFESTVVVGGPGDRQSVEVPPLVLQPAIAVLAASPSPLPSSNASMASVTATPAAPARRRWKLAWMTTGIGAAALAAGLGFGTKAWIDSNESKRICTNNQCVTSEGLQKHQDAMSESAVATYVVPAGAAVLGLGLYLLYTSGASPPAPARASPPRALTARARLRMVPAAGAGMAALSVQGLW
jgi:hypothetical protein